MNITLIIRPELFSIFIMIFLIIYDRYCAKFRAQTNRNDFFKLALVCLGHCILALATEITVNIEGLNKTINDGCHILLFLFSLLFCLYYFEYALSLVIPEFLFTAQSLTLTVLGLFFAIENPVEKIIKQSFIDVVANTWNRNCFEYDIEHVVGIQDLQNWRRLN